MTESQWKLKPGWVTFAGAGPGAVDLLTIRCRDAIAQADLIICAGSLVNPEVLRFARPTCVLFDSATLTLPEIVNSMVKTANAGKRTLRLHTGDPAMYGAIAEQMRALDEAGIEYEVIPGVSSVFAAAAELKTELTLPGHSQTVILTRRAGRTPVPAGQDLVSLSAHQATMALFLSVDEIDVMMRELTEGGYPLDTPIAVVYRASWPDQIAVRGTIATIAEQVRAAGITRQAIVLVGSALKGRGDASKLYDPGFTHGYRRGADDPAHGSIAGAPKFHPPVRSFLGPVAVYALTAEGAERAIRLGQATGWSVFISRKHAAKLKSDRTDGLRPADGMISDSAANESSSGASAAAVLFDPVQLGAVVAEQWGRYAGHVFIMATGIVVRKMAPLLRDKTQDPAVVVCDERGHYAVSLLSGHIGGGNRLAVRVAAILDGQAVVTTATDAQHLPAFDEIAAQQGWDPVQPSLIKVFNSFLLERKLVGVIWPESVHWAHFTGRDSVWLLPDLGHIPDDVAGVVVVGEQNLATVRVPVLQFRPLPLVVGVGCNRNTSASEIRDMLDRVLEETGMDLSRIRCVATVDLKQDEVGLVTFAAEGGWPVQFFSVAQLKSIPVPSPSATVQTVIGTSSVSEAAALLSGGGRLLVSKQKSGNVTLAVATWAKG